MKSGNMSISAAQCRAGRGLLDWTQEILAKNAHVSRATVADFERSIRIPTRNNLISITCALEAAGVAFIQGDNQGAGVRFREQKLEYTKTLRPVAGGLRWPVRYEGEDFSVIIPTEVIEDIDRDIDQASDPTWEMQAKAVSNLLHVFVQVAEREVREGHISNANHIVLTHEKFPIGIFGSSTRTICRLCGGPVVQELIEDGTRLSVYCENPRCGPHIIDEAAWPLFEEWINVNPQGRRSRLQLAVSSTPESEVPVLDAERLESLTARLTGPSGGA